METKVSGVLAMYVGLNSKEQRQFVFELAEHVLAQPLVHETPTAQEQIGNPLCAGSGFGPEIPVQNLILNRVH